MTIDCQQQPVIGSNEQIISLFKARPPFQKVSDGDGFGYFGVILYDKNKDKIQCHLCGKWFFFIGGSHLHRKHKMPLGLYRERFGLPISFGLCGKRVSALRAKTANNHVEKIMPWTKGEKHRYAVKCRKYKSNGRDRASWKNSIGLCDLQKYDRFRIVQAMAGRESPTNKEIKKYDSQLWGALTREPGSINGWRDRNGIDTRPRGQMMEPYGEIAVLAALRKWADEFNRVPTSRAWNKNHNGYPGLTTIVRYFGSFRAALSRSGLSR